MILELLSFFVRSEREGIKGPMKVAVVHDWLVTWAGAERVLAEILGLIPQADLFVLFDRLPENQRKCLPKDPKGETFLGRIPGVEKIYRNLLPLMPTAIESMDLSSYDLILSSSHAVAKGILLRPGQLHLCYCHTPPRYLWDMTEAYFSRTVPGALRKMGASLFFPWLRRWDFKAGQRPNAFIANSEFVARRISRIYRRTSTVLYPPVDVDRFIPKDKPGGEYFVTLGRLVPYKNLGKIARAFTDLSHRLVIVGDGPGRKELESIVQGRRNIEWHRWVSDAEWAEILRKARAFVFMAEEDFGIAPVEAQAAGVPVIAWGKGGVLETVKSLEGKEDPLESQGAQNDATGLFYGTPTSEGLREGVETFVRIEERFDPKAIRKNAERFSRETFRIEYEKFVREEWSRHEEGEVLSGIWESEIRKEEPS